MKRYIPSAVLALCLLMLAGAPALAQRTSWLTGGPLTKQLKQPLVYHCANAPIRRTLQTLSEKNRVALLLDRRVDSSRKLQLQADDVSLRAVFNGVAKSYNSMHAWPKAFPLPAAKIEVTQFDSVIYVGPEIVARHLRTIAERRRDDVRKLSTVQARGLTSRSRLQWDDLSTPKQILAAMAKKARVEIAGLEELIPHDLWAAADFPLMSFTDRLTLLAVQFDLTFRVEPGGQRVTLVKVSDKDLILERSHPGGGNSKKLADAWQKARPDAKIDVQGAKLLVRGRLEDHEWRTNPGRGETNAYTFTIRTEKLGTVVAGIAKQLNLNLKLDEAAIKAAGIDLEKRINGNFVQPTVDQLFAEVLKPHGLKHRLQDNVIVVTPAR